MKDMILFPFLGIYKYTIKIHENFRIDEELAIIMKLGLIIMSLVIFINPLTVTLLLLGNILNIPLVLILGGKENMWKTKTEVKNIDYSKVKLNQVDDSTVVLNTEGLNTENTKGITEKYFNEDKNIINKMSSILRFGVIDGLRSFIKNPKGIFEAGLTRLFMEDDIEYIKPDIFEDEEGNPVDLKVEDVVDSLKQINNKEINIEEDNNKTINEEEFSNPIDMSNYQEAYMQNNKSYIDNNELNDNNYSNNSEDYDENRILDQISGDYDENNESYDENNENDKSMLDLFASTLEDNKE